MGVGRVIGVTAGTLAILAVGLYGPATLLGPLPEARATSLEAPVESGSAPVLPETGASAVTEGVDSAAMSVAGDTAPVPMAAATKVVTALVALDAHPLAADDEGDVVPITSDDFLSYRDYRAAGARTVTVYTDDAWSERGMLQALLLGSSNNHADTLARWAFGSVEEYLVAARAWLDENGLEGITVADATGLSSESVGTAQDLAAVAALALADPAVSSILASEVTGLPSRRGIENTTTYLPELGITGISRSYTDAAGICLLFRLSVPVGEETYELYGAILRQADWDALEAAVRALTDQASGAVVDAPLIAEGTPLVRFDTEWGESVTASVGASLTSPRWVASTPSIETTLDPLVAAGAGRIVGSAVISAGGRSVTAPLKLDERLQDPGVLWRITHPIPVITAFVEDLRSR
jgi:D-alanyl-D-alanine carboxypeptidase (penicillin-binding protein 5/6)